MSILFVFPFQNIMPEPLKEIFNPSAVSAISDLVKQAYGAFDVRSFRRTATAGLSDLELLPALNTLQRHCTDIFRQMSPQH